MATVPLLTADQEVALAATIEAGVLAQAILDGTLTAPVPATEQELALLVGRGVQAWQDMWSANLRLAWMLAARAQRHYGGSLDDLGQEAQIGLADALMHWDHTRGVRFSTHAWRWIRWRLAVAGRSELRHRTRLSIHDQLPDQADVQAESSVVAWVEHQLPGWLWRLPRQDRALLVRRHGPEQASIEDLAREWQVAATTVRRAERRALARARLVLEAAPGKEWGTMVV